MFVLQIYTFKQPRQGFHLQPLKMMHMLRELHHFTFSSDAYFLVIVSSFSRDIGTMRFAFVVFEECSMVVRFMNKLL